MKPSPWWSRAWRFWFFVGFLLEMVSLFLGKPLTGVARRRVLVYRWGSGLLGAFLVWLSYHWLIDTGPGVGWFDFVVALFGSGLGLAGWYWRERTMGRHNEGR